jgi:hypothetical protein
VDFYDVARPRLMLNHVLHNREEIDLNHALLAALLSCVGVESIFGQGMSRQTLHILVNSLINAMPAQLQELIAGIDETVTSISMTMQR